MASEDSEFMHVISRGHVMAGPGRKRIPKKFLCIQMLLIFCFVFCFTSAFSQMNLSTDIKRVTFTDGTIVQGQVVQMNVETITIWTSGDSIIVRKFAEVEKLENIPTSVTVPRLEVTPSKK